MPEYKYVINQELLEQFFLADKVTEEMLTEVNKVITVVFIKHFNNYTGDPDLRQFALLAVLEHRGLYDPSFSAYNYMYTIVRNEIGNKIKKYSKEVFMEDLSHYDGIYDVDPDELPQEVRRYCEYLAGTKRFTYVKIPQVDVVNLLVYLKLHEHKSLPYVPDFMRDDPNTLPILYKLLNTKLMNE